MGGFLSSLEPCGMTLLRGYSALIRGCQSPPRRWVLVQALSAGKRCLWHAASSSEHATNAIARCHFQLI